MESKGCKRFATTEAEIEEKRLKLNAERTIKQNKAAENDVTAFLVTLSSYKSCIVDSLCEVNDELWVTHIYAIHKNTNRGPEIGLLGRQIVRWKKHISVLFIYNNVLTD